MNNSNKNEFITSLNIKLLVEVMTDENMLINLNDIEQIVTNFYNKEKDLYDNLFHMNKAFITRMIQSTTKEKCSIPITFKELQYEKITNFERQLNEKEEDFKNTISRNIPQMPNFRDKMDEPLNEMDAIIKKTIAERNYDITQINKKEKISPLFFKKYIKIDDEFIENNEPIIDLEKGENNKHISWNSNIKQEFFYEENDSIFTKQKNTSTRLEQMKQIQQNALELFIKKNTDYGDTFAKFGIIGILIRIEDNISRVINIDKNKIEFVKNEGFRDILIDLHNYSAMGLMLLDEQVNYIDQKEK